VIPAAEVTEWRAQAPWANDADVEQDLVISRAIVDLYNVELIRERTAFRGGTPLHKIVLAPASRYSDDIDLTNTSNTPIGETFTAMRKALAWLDPKPRYDVAEFPKLYFRFTTASGEKRRLKVEVATREAFSAGRAIDLPYKVASRFFTGSATVRTYALEELLATKLRALYQRQKGRDLFDLWHAAHQKAVELDRMYALFLEYWDAMGAARLLRTQVAANMADKHQRLVFEDVLPLLAPGVVYVPNEGYDWFCATILPLFPA
jgi:predicted nucleotidyltransferase component of viral defense system